MAGHFTTSYMYVAEVFTDGKVRVAVGVIREHVIE